jgi:predicted membrane-bound spermidine synthase
MLILLLFFLSGVTALIYEVIWSKYLALLLGSTIQAQTVVLAVFMGGLALGNKLFGRYADRTRNPLMIYGRIEIAIGLYAFLFSIIYRMADGIFVSVGANLLDHSGWLLLLKGILSVALLLGPTILMGGTLPILAAWLQQNTTDAGRRSARFYSTNSFGAVCGAGLAGFYLVEKIGLSRTMELTAILNVLVGLIAMLIASGRASPKPEAENESEAGIAAPPETTAGVFHWGCVLVTLTGAVSMGLEVLASRCLCLIFGASLQVFAIVLMAFILGISFGSAVIASPRRRQWPKEMTTIVLLLVAAVLIGLVVFNIENLAAIYLYAQSGLQRTAVGYCYHQILASIVSILVMGLPAAALGSVLPLWIRGSESSHLLGNRVGRLVTWNTLGAVGGVLLAGFVLLPKIGLRGSFTTMALILAVAATLMALTTRRRMVGVVGFVIGLLILIVSVRGGEEWRYIFSAGVFRLPDTDAPKALIRERIKNVNLLFYEDAADATVSVESENSGSHSQIALLINGKTDATSIADRSTQILLAQLPLMVKPDSKDVFCFGMGSGMTAGSALGYPIEHLTVAENCAPVLQAAKLFAPWNNGVLTNDRVRIYHEDARTVLKLNSQQYDVIISEPSNPWMVGIGSVFSREFYQLAASRLKPGGIFTQWFHMYEMDDDTLNLVLRTFGSVFPNMEIWDVGDEDVVLLGSAQPWESSPAVYQRAFALDGPRRDLEMIGLMTPEAMLARQFASQRTAYAVSGPGPVQSDDFPILEYAAPRAFYMYQNRQGVQQMQKYDERTWQTGIAPPPKNKVLADLGLVDLISIFGRNFSSGNQQLQSFLNDRFQGQVGSLTFGNLIMPCVFQDTNSRALVYEPPSAATNLNARELYFAEVILKTEPARQSQAIEAIQLILASVKDYKPQDSDWSAAYYADLAVKTSLRLGNAAKAKAILLRGLQLEPDSEELAYLSRILIREGILQPSEVPAAVVK